MVSDLTDEECPDVDGPIVLSERDWNLVTQQTIHDNDYKNADETWITPEIEAIVAQSIKNMDAGRLSEPINEQVDEMLTLLQDELDEDWDDRLHDDRLL